MPGERPTGTPLAKRQRDPLQELSAFAKRQARMDMRMLALSEPYAAYAGEPHNLSVPAYLATLDTAAADLFGEYPDDESLSKDLDGGGWPVTPAEARRTPAYARMRERLAAEAEANTGDETLADVVARREGIVARATTELALFAAPRERLKAVEAINDRAMAKKSRDPDVGRLLQLPQDLVEVLRGTLEIMAEHQRSLPPAPEEKVIDASVVRVE